MRLKSIFKFLSVIAMSMAVPIILHAVGVTNPIVGTLATAVPAIIGLFMTSPMDEK